MFEMDFRHPLAFRLPNHRKKSRSFHFPGVVDYPILEGYITEAQQLDGFGTNSPLFMRFEDPIDSTLLPSAENSAHPDSSLFLLNIDPLSDARGMLTPIEWHFQEEATRWQPTNLLAVQPVWGMPLRPKTRYALVVTTDLAKKEPLFQSLVHRSQSEYAIWKDLADTLRLAHIDQDRVAYASQFTTQDTTGEMARLVYRVQEGMQTDRLDQELEFIRSNPLVFRVAGPYSSSHFPTRRTTIFDRGRRGLSLMNKNGRCWRGWESVEMVVTVPASSEEPDNGWPVGALRSWNRRKCRRVRQPEYRNRSGEHAGQRWSRGTRHCFTLPW